MPDLYQELSRLADSEMYPFHMPGHKRNLESTPMKGAFRCDITEIDGFDNLHDESGIILEAENRANELYGSGRTYFLVNGSTSGVLAAVSAALNEGDTILAARGCHRSFYNAVYLRHLNIVYLPYKSDPIYGIPDSYTREDISTHLTEEVKAVFITSPTYEGKCSDIKGIADVCHEKNIPLIVDAAHGAHLGFESSQVNDNIEYDRLPQSAVQQGADLVIHSVHKTLPSMTQTALLHVQGKLIDRDRLRRFLRIYQTSSPSYVFMASIDSCMDYLDGTNKGFFDNLIKYKEEIIQATANTRHIKVFGNDIINDAAKVVISVKNTTMTGQQLYDILREDYDLQLEMAGASYGLAIISGLDTQEGIRRLIRAIIEIDEQLSEKNDSSYDEMLYHNEVIMPIYKAWDSDYDILRLDHATGSCSADFINLYPPGIPLVVPGEIITQKLIDDLKSFIKQGMNVQGVLDINGCCSVKVIVKK
jgi:arginine/lysine/ornithine decarboxylase